MTGLRPIVDSDLHGLRLLPWTISSNCWQTRYMFGGKGQVGSMTVRCAAGNGVGSAAQHLQSLRVLVHLSQEQVVALEHLQDMKGLLKSSIRDNNPVIILEYKSEFNQKGKCRLIQTTQFHLGWKSNAKGTDVTVVACGKCFAVVQAFEELVEGVSVGHDYTYLFRLIEDIIINSVKDWH